MVVESPVLLRDKTAHLKINDAAKMQHLFLDRGSIDLSSIERKLLCQGSSAILDFRALVVGG